MKHASTLAILVIVGILLTVCACREMDPIQLISAKDKEILPEISIDEECTNFEDGAIVIPLVSDDNNIFNIDLNINDVWVRAAVDTGSEALVISGEDCEKCKLNSDEQGAIPMPSKPIHVSMMRYGSQQDSVEWDIRPVILKGWKFTCLQDDDDSALTLMDDPAHKPVCMSGKVNLAVVKERTGTSNYNVLGLGARTQYGPPSFLNSMFPEPPRAYSIYVRSLEHARLVLHRPTASCTPPKHLFKIDRGDMMSHQYLLRFDKIMLNEDDTLFENIDVDRYRLMLDTGANAISLPRKIYEIFSTMPPKGKMTLAIENIHGDTVHLSFPYDMDNRFNAQVLDGGYSSKLIVGVTFMVGLGIGIHDTGDERYVSVDW